MDNIIRTCFVCFVLCYFLSNGTATDSTAPITQLCAPKTKTAADSDVQFPCNCPSIPADDFGFRIDCRNVSLSNQLFEAELLPRFAQQMDMSNNFFDVVPNFQSDDLLLLDLSNNVITVIDDYNFAKLPRLQTLNLRGNKIAKLSINAFHGIHHLSHLDISRNQLKVLPVSVFSKLTDLITLDLSRNRNLDATFSQPDVELYLGLGVTPHLQFLHIEESGLTRIQLTDGIGLKELHLKYNRLQELPSDLPANINRLDLSGNPIRELGSKDLPHELRELLLMDMPNMTHVPEYALIGVPKLRKLSFKGSYRLESFEEGAFGDVNSTSLEELDLSGTLLKFVNNSVAMNRLTSLSMLGSPIVCDCTADWIVDRKLNTEAECSEPDELRGRQLVQLRVEELVCRRWPSWVYTTLNGLVVMLLLVLCIGATWLLVSHLGPARRKAKQMRTVGANSPYARVTIESTEAIRDRRVVA